MKTPVKTITILAVSVLVTTFLTASKPADAGDIIYIHPWTDEVTITTHQHAVILHGWGACTRGLTEDGIRGSRIEVILTFEGEIVQQISPRQASTLWSAPSIWDANLDMCMFPALHTWKATWQSNRLHLARVGDYDMVFSTTPLEPLIDGMDGMDGNDPDGHLDVYQDPWVHHTTIHVVEQP
jgi:hypothetical protein